MLQHAVLFNVFKHPVAADVLLHSTRDAVQTAMVRNDCATELRNVIFEINQVFALFVRDDIVEVNVLVAPFKVVDDALVGQLFLHDENVLEEINDSFVYVKVIELRNHRLLILEIPLICVN